MMKTKTIGLTGGIGSGKTTVAKIFQSLGVEIFDADVIVHQLLESNQNIINTIKKLATDTIMNNNKINRKKLRELVFHNPSLKQALEQLLHPLVLAEIRLLSQQVKKPYCIAVIPLLFETNSEHIVDEIVVVDCDESTQLSRAMQRDNASEEIINAILSAQFTREKRLAKAHHIINNDSSEDNLRQQVDALHRYFMVN